MINIWLNIEKVPASIPTVTTNRVVKNKTSASIMRTNIREIGRETNYKTLHYNMRLRQGVVSNITLVKLLTTVKRR